MATVFPIKMFYGLQQSKNPTVISVFLRANIKRKMVIIYKLSLSSNLTKGANLKNVNKD